MCHKLQPYRGVQKERNNVFFMVLAEVCTRYFKSTDDTFAVTLLKKYQRYFIRYIFEKVPTVPLLGTVIRYFSKEKFCTFWKQYLRWFYALSSDWVSYLRIVQWRAVTLLVGKAQFFFTLMFAKKLFKTINDEQIIVFIAIQGRREGGAGGENDPGAHGPSGRPSASAGPSKWHWEISMWILKTFFFFILENT